MKILEDPSTRHPSYAPPFLKAGKLMIGQTANILQFLGPRLDLVLVDSPEAACEGADVLAIVTEWSAFKAPDFARIKALLKTPAIFDGRNLYDPALLRERGFEYFPIGRRQGGAA